IDLAKRIEEGVREVLSALGRYPNIIADVLNDYARYERQEARLNDIISGFTDLEIEASPLVESTEEAELIDDAEDEAPLTNEKDEFAEEDSSDADSGGEGEGDGGDEDGESEFDGGPDPVLAQQRFTVLREHYEKYAAAVKRYGRNHKTSQK